MEKDYIEEKLLTPAEAADYLNVSLTWLQEKRAAGNGPPAIKIGHRTVRYRRCELEAWLERRRLH